MQDLPQPEDLLPDIDTPRPISVTFIPATVFDNPILLRVNPEYFTWLLSLPLLERERLLDGNWKVGRRPAYTSSGSGAPSLMRSRPTPMSCAIGISPPPKRESSTTPIGRSASSSGGTRTAATRSWIWRPGGPTRMTPKDCAQYCHAGRRARLHRLRQGSRAGRQNPGVTSRARAQWLHRNAGYGERGTS